MLTKGTFTRDEWHHLLRLLNIMIFPMFSCSHLGEFLFRCQREFRKWKRSAVAKSKLMNLNLSSLRKIPPKDVRDQSLDQSGVPTRSWKQSAWTTDDGPTMFSQDRQQNDAQTSNTRKQGRRDESSAQPAAGNSLRKGRGEVHPFGRRKPEFHNMRISRSRVLGESVQQHKEKGESCRRCTNHSCWSKHTEPTFWSEEFYVGINEGSDFIWDQIFSEIFGSLQEHELRRALRICTTSPESWYTSKARFWMWKWLNVHLFHGRDPLWFMIRQSSGQRQKYEFIQVQSYAWKNRGSCRCKSKMVRTNGTISTNWFLQRNIWNWWRTDWVRVECVAGTYVLGNPPKHPERTRPHVYIVDARMSLCTDVDSQCCTSTDLDLPSLVVAAPLSPK